MQVKIRKEVVDLMDPGLSDRTFVEMSRELSHRLMDDLSREEIYLMLGLSHGRLMLRVEKGEKH